MARLVLGLIAILVSLSGCEAFRPVSAEQAERISSRSSSGTLIYGTECRYDNGRVVTGDSSTCPVATGNR